MLKINLKEYNRTKKIIYLLAWLALGILLSIISHSLIEMLYISTALRNGQNIIFYGSCAIHPIFQIIILLLGLIFGYFSGKYWWQKIYIERILDKRKI